MVAIVIPFTIFYYEADSETCVTHMLIGQRSYAPLLVHDFLMASSIWPTANCARLGVYVMSQCQMLAHRYAAGRACGLYLAVTHAAQRLGAKSAQRHAHGFNMLHIQFNPFVAVFDRTRAQRILSACAYSGITAVIIAVLYGFAYGAHPAAELRLLSCISMRSCV